MSKNMQENTKKSKQKSRKHSHRYPKNESICWSCECALCTQTHSCEWSKRFDPVPGWETQEGAILSTGEAATIVLNCPKYYPHFKYVHPQDVKRTICRALKIRAFRFKSDPLGFCQEYEKKTGETLPRWYIEHLEMQVKRIEKLLKTRRENKLKQQEMKEKSNDQR